MADCRVALPLDGGKENKEMIEILLTSMEDEKKNAHDMHQEKNDTVPMTIATELKTMLFPPLLSTSRTDNNPQLAGSNGGGNSIECLPIQNRTLKSYFCNRVMLRSLERDSDRIAKELDIRAELRNWDN